MRDLPRIYTEGVGHVTVDDSGRTAVLLRRAKVYWVRFFAAGNEHATGARVISQALHELQHRGGGLALTTACAAGGIGAAMVLETE